MRERIKFEVRPIPARLLKSLGDSLRPYLSESRVLDLYAGTGSMGLKLLAEGAATCDFVETNRKLCQSIQAELKKRAWEGSVCCQSVEEFLKQSEPEAYDIVLADPPFPLWEDANFTLQFPQDAARLVNKSGLFVMKVPSGLLPPPSICDLNRKKSSAVGDSQLVYYEAAPNGN